MLTSARRIPAEITPSASTLSEVSFADASRITPAILSKAAPVRRLHHPLPILPIVVVHICQ